MGYMNVYLLFLHVKVKEVRCVCESTCDIMTEIIVMKFVYWSGKLQTP